jgi:hypothetical protein
MLGRGLVWFVLGVGYAIYFVTDSPVIGWAWWICFGVVVVCYIRGDRDKNVASWL